MEDNPDDPKEESYMNVCQEEHAILSQMVKLLVREKLVSPEEHLRFLALLKEEA